MTSSTDSAAMLINALLTNAATASLGTLSATGAPFVSLVNIAPLDSRHVIMLLSGLAQHTRNLRDDPRTSLLIVGPVEPQTDALSAHRVTLSGRTSIVKKDHDDLERQCMLQRHPSAAMYAELGDFSIYRFEIIEAHLVAGFGQIRTVPAEKLI